MQAQLQPVYIILARTHLQAVLMPYTSSVTHELISNIKAQADYISMLLQAQLLILSRLCWSEPFTDHNSSSHQLSVHAQFSGSTGVRHLHSEIPSCRWAAEGFPKGPALLSYLYAELADADSNAAPLMRFLFVSAFQPLMHHVRTWMYSTKAVGLAFVDVPIDNGSSLLPITHNRMVSVAP